MMRILVFFAVVFALGLGFAWLADRPGDLVMTFAGYRYEVSLMVAAAALVAIVFAVMASWWVVKVIWTSPHAIRRYFRVRRRDRGYQALSTGMIAAGAGDAVLARKKKKEAMQLISSDQEPLIHLLDAQASLLEGDHDGAREKFKAMLDDPETRLLGLRGLFLEAERLGERQAARHYARQAADAAPQLAWAAEATLEERAEAGDWDEALRLVDAQKATKQVGREWTARRRAVLLTAKATAQEAADPAAARAAALEAVRLQPDFVPATLAAARVLFRLDELRKGAKLLETLWKTDAHPQIADLYVHARPGDSAQDRLTRARRLQSLRNNNAVASHVVAQAALQAGDYALAREEAGASIRLEPRESAYLLMADIEEAQTGEQGKVREWLQRALRAPRDAAWVADGYVSETWAPFSPVTGRIDAFQWRVPVEKVAQTIDAAPREAVLGEPVAAPDEAIAQTIDVIEATAEPVAEPPAEPPAKPVAETPPVERPAAQPASVTPPAEPVAAPSAGRTAFAPREADRAQAEARRVEMAALSRLPDDPGIGDDDDTTTDADRYRAV